MFAHNVRFASTMSYGIIVLSFYLTNMNGSFHILIGSLLVQYTSPRNNGKTKQTKHRNLCDMNSSFTEVKHKFAAVELRFAAANPRMAKLILLATPLHGGPSPLQMTLDIAQNLLFLVIFPYKSNQKHNETHIFSRKTSPKYVLTQPKPIIGSN